MLARKVRNRITLLFIVIPMAVILSGVAVYIHLSESNTSHVPSVSPLSLQDVDGGTFLSILPRKPEANEGASYLRAVEFRREPQTGPEVAAASSEHDQVLGRSIDFAARARGLVDLFKETLEGLVADNAKLERAAANLHAELGGAHQTIADLKQRHSAEKLKSDGLIEEYRALSDAAKNEAEALASRYQKLEAEQQEALALKQTIEELRAELSDARNALSAALQRRATEKQASDRLTEKLEKFLAAASRDVEILTSRNQKLAAEYEAVVTAKGQNEKALGEIAQKPLDVENRNGQALALLDRGGTQPKDTQEQAETESRMRAVELNRVRAQEAQRQAEAVRKKRLEELLARRQLEFAQAEAERRSRVAEQDRVRAQDAQRQAEASRQERLEELLSRREAEFAQALAEAERQSRVAEQERVRAQEAQRQAEATRKKRLDELLARRQVEFAQAEAERRSRVAEQERGRAQEAQRQADATRQKQLEEILSRRQAEFAQAEAERRIQVAKQERVRAQEAQRQAEASRQERLEELLSRREAEFAQAQAEAQRQSRVAEKERVRVQEAQSQAEATRKKRLEELLARRQVEFAQAEAVRQKQLEEAQSRRKAALALAAARQRLAKEAHGVVSRSKDAIMLATDKLTTFDRDAGNLTSSLKNTSEESARISRMFQKIDQELAARERSEAESLATLQEGTDAIRAMSNELVQDANSLGQASVAIEANKENLDRIANAAVDLQAQKTSIQSRVKQLAEIRQSVSGVSKEAGSAASTVLEKTARISSLLRESRGSGSNEQTYSLIETELQTAKRDHEAAGQLLSRLTAAKTDLRARISTLSEDASKLSRQHLQNLGELRTSEGDLNELSKKLRAQLATRTEQAEFNGKTLVSYRQQLAVPERPFSRLRLDLAELDKRLSDTRAGVRASEDTLKAARIELSEQAASMKAGQAAIEAVKGKLHDIAKTAGEGAVSTVLLGPLPVELASTQVETDVREQRDQATSEQIDASLAETVEANRALNARIQKVGEIEAGLQEFVLEIEGMKRRVGARLNSLDDVGTRSAQLASRYKEGLEQSETLARAQTTDQENTKKILTRIASLQDRLPLLQSQLQTASLDEGTQSGIPPVLPATAIEKFEEWWSQFARIGKKLGVLSRTLQSRRARSPDPGRRVEANSSFGFEQSGKPTVQAPVGCDLKRPSCRRWLFLQKRKMLAVQGAATSN